MELRTLEDRARAALNCLVGNTDPQWRRLPYVWTYLKPSPPAASHGAGPRDFGDVAGRWIDALALARHMTGSETGVETEEVLRNYFLTLLDDADGLCYSEKTAWCEREVEVACERGALLALATWFLDTGDGYIAWLAERLVRGLLSIARVEGDTLHFPRRTYRRGRWLKSSPPGDAADDGAILTPVVRLLEATSSRDAERFVRLFANHIIADRAAFAEDGSFVGPTHTRLGTAAGLMRAGLALHDERYFDLGRRIYECSRAVTASTGWIPGFLGRDPLSDEGCETCALADALDCSLLLAANGDEARWDDVERLVRNQLFENQLTDVSWLAPAKKRLGLPVRGKPRKDALRTTHDDVAARVTGGFAGWAAPNDFVGAAPNDLIGAAPNDFVGVTRVKDWAMQHCCTASGVRALYLAWHSAVVEHDGTVAINLHFDRDTRAGELRTHLPHKGKLVFALARRRRLRVRLPAGVAPDDLTVYVNARCVTPRARGRWLVLDELAAADVVSVNYPLHVREGWEVIGGRTFRLRWKGNAVTAIEPRGEIRPLYQRKDYETAQPPRMQPKLHLPKGDLAW